MQLCTKVNSFVNNENKWQTPNLRVTSEALRMLQANTPFTPAKHVLLNWFSLNENYKQRTEKLDFPLDSSTC